MKAVPLGSLCELRNGRAFKPEEWSDHGTPIVRIQNLNDESKPFNYCNFEVDRKFFVESGDLLFSWSGTPGTSFGAFFWNRGRGFLNQHIFRVDTNEKVDRSYLRYALNSLLDKIIDESHGGVGLKHITKGKLESVEIPLPSIFEQRRIAAILDKAAALRAKRREAIAKLDQLLESVFLDMFGDPVMNPKGWLQSELVEICDPHDRVNYGVVQPGDDVPGGVPLVRVGDIDGGKLELSSVKRIDPSIEAVYRRSRLKGNELLVSCVGSIGTIASVPEAAHGFNIARAITRVPLVNPESMLFVRECLRSPAVQRYFAEKTRTVSQPTLNVSFVKSAPVIRPPASLIVKFCEIAEVVERKMQVLVCSEDKVAELFQALQNRAFSGELARNS